MSQRSEAKAKTSGFAFGRRIILPARIQSFPVVRIAAVWEAFLVAAGSLPPGVPHDVYAELLGKASAAGVRPRALTTRATTWRSFSSSRGAMRCGTGDPRRDRHPRHFS